MFAIIAVFAICRARLHRVRSLRAAAGLASCRDGGNDIRAGALLFAAIEQEWHAAIRAAALDGLAAAAVTQQAVADSCAQASSLFPGTPG